VKPVSRDDSDRAGMDKNIVGEGSSGADLQLVA